MILKLLFDTVCAQGIPPFDSRTNLHVFDWLISRSSDEDDDSHSQSKSESDVDEFGRKVYRPSETFKMVQEQESDDALSSTKSDESYKVNPSRTFKKLQSALGVTG